MISLYVTVAHIQFMCQLYCMWIKYTPIDCIENILDFQKTYFLQIQEIPLHVTVLKKILPHHKKPQVQFRSFQNSTN